MSFEPLAALKMTVTKGLERKERKKKIQKTHTKEREERERERREKNQIFINTRGLKSSQKSALKMAF